MIDVAQKAGNMLVVDTVENVLDGLISNSRELDGHRSLQDADSANVLVDNSFKILGLPQ